MVRFEYPITNNQILEDGFEISYDNNTFYSNCQEDYGIIKISSNPSSPYNDIYPYMVKSKFILIAYIINRMVL